MHSAVGGCATIDTRGISDFPNRGIRRSQPNRPIGHHSLHPPEKALVSGPHPPPLLSPNRECIPTHSHSLGSIATLLKMALRSATTFIPGNLTRLTLPPTLRALPNGVPMAMGINRDLPPAPGGHDDHGGSSAARADKLPSWAGIASGVQNMTRLTRQSLLLTRGNPIMSLAGAMLTLVIALPVHNVQCRRFSTSSPVPAASPSTEVPDFGGYKAANPNLNRTLSYFMVGSLGMSFVSAITEATRRADGFKVCSLRAERRVR